MGLSAASSAARCATATPAATTTATPPSSGASSACGAVAHDGATVAFACALEPLVLVASVCCAVPLAVWLVFWLGRAIALLTLVGTARAATHQVTPSSDWQSVVGNATAEDVVEFADGSYTAACSTNGAMLTISAGITLRAQHPGQAALDAQASSSNPCGVMFIDVASGAAEVSGLTITGGYTVGVCMHCLPIKLS
jgi:hypothetical protein